MTIRSVIAIVPGSLSARESEFVEPFWEAVTQYLLIFK